MIPAPARPVLALAALLASRPLLASPEDDPAAWLLAQASREAGADRFLGDGEWGWAALARRRAALDETGLEPWGSTPVEPWLRAHLGPELRALQAPREPVWALRPSLAAALGRMPPVGQGGDLEPGLASLRAGADVRAQVLGLEAEVAPALALDADAGGVAPGFLPRHAWGGWRGEHLLVGFGMRDRWLGPGRHGALLLSDQAWPAPLGTIAGDGHLPGRAAVLGRWRFESSWGWLQRPRDDVAHPGLLLMDARWQPVTWIEVGGTRMALFGGEGRPLPEFWELLIPLDPHVEGDPEKAEADQNEMAALDLRLTLPLRRWLGGPVRYVEGWWQYGAEDVIAREIAGVPVPSLAGVANLWGVEAAVGAWTATYEGARILDDYFRWYTGHRVYHDGFTQDGVALGHPIGGDAMSAWLRLAFAPLPWGFELRWEQARRVGVVEDLGENLLALATDELRRGAEARAWRLTREGGHWSVGYGLERVTGLDFVPGATAWRHRIAATWSPGPLRERGEGGAPVP